MANNVKKKIPLALIVGVGDGLSAAIARLLSKNGYQLALAARNTDKIASLADEIKASRYACDATLPGNVQNLFDQIVEQQEEDNQELKVVIYNPGLRIVSPITEADPAQVKKSMDVTAFGSFLVGQQAAKTMLKNNTKGTILFTGATAGIKGFPKSAAFAMGKFAQRGLSESMARELHPQGIHVCWLQIDGIIKHPTAADRFGEEPIPDAYMEPGSIAETYLHIINQHRSTWTNEVALRSFVEKW